MTSNVHERDVERLTGAGIHSMGMVSEEGGWEKRKVEFREETYEIQTTICTLVTSQRRQNQPKQ